MRFSCKGYCNAAAPRLPGPLILRGSLPAARLRPAAAATAADRGPFLAPRRLHRGDRQGNRGGEKNVRVQAFSFTSRPIARALVEAHRRGVDVRVIFDDKESHEEFSLAEMLHDAKIPVLTDALHSIAHNKVVIVDDAVVITGSFNFTRQAENGNAENLLVIRDREIARQYAENWAGHACAQPALGV